ncbi:MAG TPA: sialate O-acetylesterase [Rhizomicrobium sp.]
MIVEGYDILIQGGQSNGVGYGLGPYDTDTLTDRDDRIVQVGRHGGDNGKIIPAFPHLHFHQAEKFSRYGYTLSLARRYAATKLRWRRMLLIVPAAKNGSSSTDWLGYLYDDMAERIRVAKALPGANRIVLYTEHQGEADTPEPEGNIDAAIERFKANKQKFIRRFRAEFGSVPMLFGGYAPAWVERRPEREALMKATREICEKTPNAAFVPASSLTSNRDERIHFDAQSQETLSARHFLAFCNLADAAVKARFDRWERERQTILEVMIESICKKPMTADRQSDRLFNRPYAGVLNYLRRTLRIARD